MSDKKKFEPIVTPVGTAHYPRLTEPDDMDKRYKISLELSDEDAEALIQQMNAAAERFGVRKKIPAKSKDGIMLFTFKTHKAPKVVDSQNKPVPAGVRVASGSRVRVRGSLAPYESFEGGITAYLNAVQVVELNEGSGGFDKVDGYVYDDGDPF